MRKALQSQRSCRAPQQESEILPPQVATLLISVIPIGMADFLFALSLPLEYNTFNKHMEGYL
jgi:hypothetical protein